MINSMTAFATQQGHMDGASWTWEVRSVNGRGLDVKLRLPDGMSALEGVVRDCIAKAVKRGSITIGLRLQRDQSDGGLDIDPSRLDTILDALDSVQERAFDKGVTLAQPTAADVLAQRGVLVAAQAVQSDDVITALTADFETALGAMGDMRAAEGRVLADILSRHVDEIETLTAQAITAAQARSSAQKHQINAALNRVMDNADGADPDRVAQELALIAIKSDITEELDRLSAHIKAARDLLAHASPIGRKFDFLTQEFNREANTLCSKAGDIALTQIGLALKAVIDQMREQVQNVE